MLPPEEFIHELQNIFDPMEEIREKEHSCSDKEIKDWLKTFRLKEEIEIPPPPNKKENVEFIISNLNMEIVASKNNKTDDKDKTKDILPKEEKYLKKYQIFKQEN